MIRRQFLNSDFLNCPCDSTLCPIATRSNPTSHCVFDQRTSILTDSLNILAVIAYVAATALTIRSMGPTQTQGKTELKALRLVLVVGLFLHGSALATVLGVGNSPNFALGTTVSSVAWIIVMLFLVSSLRAPLTSLGILVLPTAAIATLVGWLYPGTLHAPALGSIAAKFHLLIAGLSFGLLSLAVAQSILLFLLDRLIRNKHPVGFWLSLPPMETMELILFRLIFSGFTLLTVTLISGMVFSDRLFGQPFVLNHHVTLAVLAWLSFAVLLGGHRLFGWRGRTAVNWTLASFVILALGYFGTRFILEVLLSN